MAAADQVRSKQSLIIEAAELAFAIQAGLDAIQLAAALGGIPIPSFRYHDGESHPEEAETLGEIQDWATDWTPILDQWDLSHPDPG